MRISKIKVNNFKSLVDFEANLAKFTCLVGLNGSGKSTVLQFVDFLAQLMRGDVTEWLGERDWAVADLTAWRDVPGVISYRVEMVNESGGPLGSWDGEFDTETLRCRSEVLNFGSTRFEVNDNEFTASHTQRTYPITVQYEGSLLAKIFDSFLPPPIAQFRDFFKTSRTLELLSPRLMRQRTKGPADSIGRGGERLSAYLHDLPASNRQGIEARLKEVYPHFQALVSRSVRSGTKVLEVEEAFENRRLQSEARHLNDGLLRILAIITNLASDAPLLVFDEIENGVNTELVKFLVDSLVEARPQVIVTTHNPVILNYMEDATARESMVYLYKTPAGVTRSIRFFDIPRMAKKLTMMGPGEAYGDTNLSQLNAEIIEGDTTETSGHAVPSQR